MVCSGHTVEVPPRVGPGSLVLTASQIQGRHVFDYAEFWGRG